MRELSQLVNNSEPAWPLVEEWVRHASQHVEVLPADAAAADSALLSLQVTIRSPMGSVVHNSAGILISNSWLRVLGSGHHSRFQRSLPGWNDGRSANFLLVADDVVGGSFAINGGAFGNDLGNVYFFAPDSLQWEKCGFGYSEFLVWAMSERLDQFYSSLRWKGWEAEVESLMGDQSISLYPFLWAKGAPIEERHRGVVPTSELYGMQMEFLKQVGHE